MKLQFNPKQISSNPDKYFGIFRQKVLKQASKKAPVDSASFYSEIACIGAGFEAQNNIKELNRKALKLAEMLVGLGNGSLAGIVYSFLIKFNKGNYKLIETLAQNGLKIARKQNDNIHIMARLDDLREVYKQTEPGSDRHLKILYEEKRMLKNIIKNPELAKQKFQSISREAKPQDAYKVKLSSILIEIAKVLKTQDANRAHEELELAKALIADMPELTNHHIIQKLEKQLKTLGETQKS